MEWVYVIYIDLNTTLQGERHDVPKHGTAYNILWKSGPKVVA